jgi:hypothetical protein
MQLTIQQSRAAPQIAAGKLMLILINGSALVGSVIPSVQILHAKLVRCTAAFDSPGTGAKTRRCCKMSHDV